jgi:curved DNA-binding protein
VARDYYEALGVDRGASNDEIQSAFRKLARRYHPDVNKDPAAEDRFKEINEAHSVLSDPETRARYDRFGPNFRQAPDGRGAEEPGRARSRTAGARAGAGVGAGQWGDARTGRRTRASAGPGIDIEDLLGGLGGVGGNFGDMFGDFRSAGPMPGADQEAEIELSVEEAYHGGRRRITLSSGDGERSYEVTIPPGVTDGQRIRLAGQGGRAGQGGADGDLYLVVRIAPHDRYRVNGRDIVMDLPLAPWEAALGTTVAVQAPGGEVKVTVPAGSSTGRRLRLAEQGMPNRNGKPGDLYAVVRILVPSRLTRRERELFEELAETSKFDPRKQG